MKNAITVLTMACVAGAAYLLGVSVGNGPNCPTEDSCLPDYVQTGQGHGHYTGVQVTP
jgi:hypothetical protein